MIVSWITYLFGSFKQTRAEPCNTSRISQMGDLSRGGRELSCTYESHLFIAAAARRPLSIALTTNEAPLAESPAAKTHGSLV